MALSGCLAFQDFDLVEQSETLEPDCLEEGAFSCEDEDLFHCVEGALELKEECSRAELCNAGLGRCMECVPGQSKRCDGNDLLACGAEGTYDVEKRCEDDGQVCNVANPSCVDCLAGDQRCSSDETNVLTTCVGNEFAGRQSCGALGDCVSVDGRNDSCPECTEDGIGQLACRRGDLVICSENLLLEPYEQCEGSCDATTNPPSCN